MGKMHHLNAITLGSECYQSTPQDQSAFEAVLLTLVSHTGVSIRLHCAFLRSRVYAFTYGNTDYFIINYFSFSFPLSCVCV